MVNRDLKEILFGLPIVLLVFSIVRLGFYFESIGQWVLRIIGITVIAALASFVIVGCCFTVGGPTLRYYERWQARRANKRNGPW